MDLLSFLKQDHNEIRALLQRLIEKPDRQRESVRDLQEALSDLLVNHTRMEEKFLYPRLCENDRNRDLINEAFSQHETASQTLQQLSGKAIETNDWVSVCRQLWQEIDQHLQLEEGQLFPIIQRELDRHEMDGICQDMLRYRKEQLEVTPDIP